MLELIMFALGALAISFAVVWLYRKLTEFRGASMVSLSSKNSDLNVGQQQGYVTLDSGVADDLVLRQVRKSKGKSQKPWGW